MTDSAAESPESAPAKGPAPSFLAGLLVGFFRFLRTFIASVHPDGVFGRDKALAAGEPIQAGVPRRPPKRKVSAINKVADRVLPPNIEKAIGAQLEVGGKSLRASELQKFLEGMGMRENEAKHLVRVAESRIGAATFDKRHLPHLQSLLNRAYTKTQVAIHKERFGEFLAVALDLVPHDHKLGTELDLNWLRVAPRVEALLQMKGYSNKTAIELTQLYLSYLD